MDESFFFIWELATQITIQNNKLWNLNSLQVSPNLGRSLNSLYVIFYIDLLWLLSYLAYHLDSPLGGL
jgi:hypothetical protein